MVHEALGVQDLLSALAWSRNSINENSIGPREVGWNKHYPPIERGRSRPTPFDGVAWNVYNTLHKIKPDQKKHRAVRLPPPISVAVRIFTL